MRIFIKSMDGGSFSMEFNPHQTVRQFLQDAQKLLGKYTSLLFAGRLLYGSQYQNNTLSQIGVRPNSTILSVIRLRGGGISSSFPFNKLQKKIQIDFGSKTCGYRNVSGGLNMQGTCQNKDCEAYCQSVYMEKGYGTFNMAKQIYNCKCPSCKKNVQATNFGYFDTIIKVEGKQKDKSQILKWQEEVDASKYRTFQNSDADMGQWNYLQVRTIKRQK